MTVHDTEAMERELAARERVRETLAKVDRTLAAPRPLGPTWQAPSQAVAVAAPVPPTAASVPAVVRAPMPAAKQGQRIWALCSFAAGEEPTWRWLTLPSEDAIVEVLGKAFGRFTGDARREFDERRGADDARHHNTILRLAEAERRIAELEAKLPASRAKR